MKDNTEAYDIKFSTQKQLKVKIELDTDPPLLFSTEQKLLLRPYSFMTRCFMLWYVRHQVPLDFTHLRSRIMEFNGEDVDKDTFMYQLRSKLSTTNIEMVRRDVLPYVINPRELDIWSNDYFLQLADMLIFQ